MKNKKPQITKTEVKKTARLIKKTYGYHAFEVNWEGNIIYGYLSDRNQVWYSAHSILENEKPPYLNEIEADLIANLRERHEP